MNQVTQEAKDVTTKIFAIIGFIAVIIFAIWLIVNVVTMIPSAFSSLASIADGVYNTRPENGLTVAASKSIVNTDEDFTISWTDTGRTGTYAFSYECTNGVTMDVRTESGDVKSLPCDQDLELEGTRSIDVIANSDERRFVDVPYLVTFTNAGALDTFFEKTGQFTVVNAGIPQSVDVAVETETDEETETDTPGTVAGETTSEEPETPAVSTPVTGGNLPTVIEQPIFEIPTSNPRGTVDLQVTYLGVGHLENNNSFDPKADIDNDEKGSFRFAVKNIGTKTSEEWDFEATLPTGQVFKSDDQAPLKPNERAVITLGFDAVGTTGFKTIGAEVDVDDDVNNANNEFTWGVRVTD